MRDVFLVAAVEDQAQTLQVENGCKASEIFLPEDSEDRVILYELYDCEQAFQINLSTPHLIKYKAITDPLNVFKVVHKLRKVDI